MPFAKTPILNIISKNVLYFSCLIMAVVLWFYIVSLETHMQSFNVSVQYHLPSGRSLETFVPSQVEVKLRGPRHILADLKNNPLKLHMDLSNLGNKMGELNQLLFIKGQLKLPYLVYMEDASPKEVWVRMGKTIEKILKPVWDIQGLDLNDWDISPAKIKVKGAANILKNLQSLKLGPIIIDAGKITSPESFSHPIDITYFDSRMEMVGESLLTFTRKKVPRKIFQ